jgi:hypothetical protein
MTARRGPIAVPTARIVLGLSQHRSAASHMCPAICAASAQLASLLRRPNLARIDNIPLQLVNSRAAESDGGQHARRQQECCRQTSMDGFTVSPLSVTRPRKTENPRRTVEFRDLADTFALEGALKPPPTFALPNLLV